MRSTDKVYKSLAYDGAPLLCVPFALAGLFLFYNGLVCNLCQSPLVQFDARFNANYFITNIIMSSPETIIFRLFESCNEICIISALNKTNLGKVVF